MVRRARVRGGGGSPRPGRWGLGAGRPSCSPITGPACTWTGRTPPSTSCWPGSPPERARRMRSWRRWPRAMSWPAGRWRRRNGTWPWRSAGRRRCRTAGAGRRRCCSGMVRLLLARQRGNLPAVAEEAQRLQAMAEAPDAAQPGLGEELRALALISLGSAESGPPGSRTPSATWSRASRWRAGSGGPIWSSPAWPTRRRSSSTGRLRGRRSAAGRRSSWPSGTAGPTTRPLGVAYVHSEPRWSGRDGWRRQRPGSSAPSAPSEPKPSPRRGWRSATSAGCSSWRAAGTPTRWPPSGPPSGWPGASPHRTAWSLPDRALLVHALVRLGETERAEQVLAGLGDQDRDAGRSASPPRRCGSPSTTRMRRPPRSRRSSTAPPRLSLGSWLAQAFLLEAIARDALGDPAAAGRALERALDLAEPDGALIVFLLHPAPGLLERHARQRTAHAALIAEILSLLAGNRPALAARRAAAAAGAAQRQRDPGAALPADQPDRRRRSPASCTSR